VSLCLICLACILQLSSPSAVACFYLSLTHQQNIQVAITLGPKLGSKIPCSTCIPAAYPCRTPLPFLPAKQRSCQILNNENCAFPALPVAHLCRMPLPYLLAKNVLMKIVHPPVLPVAHLCRTPLPFLPAKEQSRQVIKTMHPPIFPAAHLCRMPLPFLPATHCSC